MILAEIQKFGGVVAVVAVHNQKPIRAHRTAFCVLIEMLQPRETMLKRCPSLFANRQDPVMSIFDSLIPRIVVLSAFKD